LAQATLEVSHAMVVVDDHGTLVVEGWAGDTIESLIDPLWLVEAFQNSCEPIVVEDSSQSHLRLPHYFRFCAWIPIGLTGANAFGAVALFDRRPRLFDADQRAGLSNLVDIAADLLCAHSLISDAELAASDKTRVELALAESQARYSRVAENVPGMLYQFVLSRDGSMSMPFVGSGCYELFGVQPEEAVRDHSVLTEMLHPDEQSGLQRSILQSALTGNLWEWTGQFLLPNGETKWIRGASRPTYRLNGDILWDGLMLDTTPEVVAQQALEQSEATLRLTLENAFDGIITVDRAGTIVDWNPQAQQIFGWTQAEAVGRPISIVIPEHLRDAQDHWRVEEDFPKSQRMEVPLLRKDGRVFMAELAISSVHTAAQARVVGFVRDISERIKNEQDLRQAKDAAERANLGKSEFVSRMSHELRTPLNAILGFSQLLLLDNLGTDAGENVTQIKSAGEHLLSLINEILDMAKIEAGRMSFEPETIDLRKVVTGVTALVQPLAAQKGVRLNVRFPQEISLISTDPHRVRQVLINLLSNGIKYNRQDGLLQVSLCEDSDSVSIQVRDEGRGLAPEDLGRLFVPFDRIGAERTQIEGTGLGLPLTKRLVEVMGGSIAVSSLIDVGSIFTVTLPKAIPAEMAEERYGFRSA
jgi:PAS domain S-box-containing protein